MTGPGMRSAPAPQGAPSTEPVRERVCVFTPSPLVTVTVEDREGGAPDIHFHAGGQGVWVARMLRTLGAEPILCAPLGGESGVVLNALLEAEGLTLRAIACSGANGGYLHDRRGGQREEVASAASAHLSRHEQDDLYNTALVTALECGILVLTGPAQEGILDSDVYRRLPLDVARNGALVVADLSLQSLHALEGGVSLLKVSHDELIVAGFANDDSVDELVFGMRELHRRCAEAVVVSRAHEPGLALIDGQVLEIRPVQLEPLDHRGAGDSMTAGLALGLLRGLAHGELLRLASAAGSLNVSRHGLGSGRREEIEALAARVDVRPLEM
jgi:1-phosphofructokinase